MALLRVKQLLYIIALIIALESNPQSINHLGSNNELFKKRTEDGVFSIRNLVRKCSILSLHLWRERRSNGSESDSFDSR